MYSNGRKSTYGSHFLLWSWVVVVSVGSWKTIFSKHLRVECFLRCQVPWRIQSPWLRTYPFEMITFVPGKNMIKKSQSSHIQNYLLEWWWSIDFTVISSECRRVGGEAISDFLLDLFCPQRCEWNSSCWICTIRLIEHEPNNPCMVYLPTVHLVDFYGKCSNIPYMDPMGKIWWKWNNNSTKTWEFVSFS